VDVSSGSVTWQRYPSPLRYPGGKGKIAPLVKRIFEANRLCDGHYAEPYAGGAGVALSLLYGEYATRVHINDLDRSVYAFWYSVLHETEGLCRLVRDTSPNVSEWRKQRRVQGHKADAGLLELGFSTFFLNRTNRSGIISSGGLIGGVSQAGEWAIDARLNAPDLVKRIERVAMYRDRIDLTNLDALDFLALAATSLPERSLVYLDPPYYDKGRLKLYANYYRTDDHADVALIIQACPWPWIVSYDPSPAIERLYAGRRLRRYDLRYTAASSRTGAEVMFFSDDLVIPQEIRRILHKL